MPKQVHDIIIVNKHINKHKKKTCKTYWVAFFVELTESKAINESNCLERANKFNLNTVFKSFKSKKKKKKKKKKKLP